MKHCVTLPNWNNMIHKSQNYLCTRHPDEIDINFLVWLWVRCKTSIFPLTWLKLTQTFNLIWEICYLSQNDIIMLIVILDGCLLMNDGCWLIIGWIRCVTFPEFDAMPWTRLNITWIHSVSEFILCHWTDLSRWPQRHKKVLHCGFTSKTL